MCSKGYIGNFMKIIGKFGENEILIARMREQRNQRKKNKQR